MTVKIVGNLFNIVVALTLLTIEATASNDPVFRAASHATSIVGAVGTAR